MRLRKWQRRLGTSLCLAAGIELSLQPALPAPPQEPSRTMTPAGPSAQVLPDKAVALSADGSFRAVVLAADGRPLPGARLTGVKAGAYTVRVESEKSACQGRLRVNPDNGPAGPIQQVVVFTLQPDAGCDDAGQTPRPGADPLDPRVGAYSDPGAFGEAGGAGGGGFGGGGGSRALLYGLSAGAVATAIAVPISLSNRGHNDPAPPAPVASP